ncbi:hypothetical protein GH733_013528 [Mirounga leonina]|nr:hypothetical protein GH733_013528 [Mirounga leonina]
MESPAAKCLHWHWHLDHRWKSWRSVHGWRKAVLLEDLKGLRHLVSYQDDSLTKEEGPVHSVAKVSASESLCGRNAALHGPNSPPALHLQELLVRFQEGSGSLTAEVPIDRNPSQLQGLQKFNILTSNKKILTPEKGQSEGLMCNFDYLTLVEQHSGGSRKGIIRDC